MEIDILSIRVLSGALYLRIFPVNIVHKAPIKGWGHNLDFDFSHSSSMSVVFSPNEMASVKNRNVIRVTPLCCSEKKASQGLLWRHLLSAVKGDVFVGFHSIEKDRERMIFIASLWQSLLSFSFSGEDECGGASPAERAAAANDTKWVSSLNLKGYFTQKYDRFKWNTTLNPNTFWVKSHLILVIHQTDVFLFFFIYHNQKWCGR